MSLKCKNIDKMVWKWLIQGWFYFTLAEFIAFGEYHIYIPATPLSIISLAQERPVPDLLHTDHEYYQEKKKLMNSSMLRLVSMLASFEPMPVFETISFYLQWTNWCPKVSKLIHFCCGMYSTPIHTAFRMFRKMWGK